MDAGSVPTSHVAVGGGDGDYVSGTIKDQLQPSQLVAFEGLKRLMTS